MGPGAGLDDEQAIMAQARLQASRDVLSVHLRGEVTSLKAEVKDLLEKLVEKDAHAKQFRDRVAAQASYIRELEDGMKRKAELVEADDAEYKLTYLKVIFFFLSWKVDSKKC